MKHKEHVANNNDKEDIDSATHIICDLDPVEKLNCNRNNSSGRLDSEVKTVANGVPVQLSSPGLLKSVNGQQSQNGGHLWKGGTSNGMSSCQSSKNSEPTKRPSLVLPQISVTSADDEVEVFIQ